MNQPQQPSTPLTPRGLAVSYAMTVSILPDNSLLGLLTEAFLAGYGAAQNLPQADPSPMLSIPQAPLVPLAPLANLRAGLDFPASVPPPFPQQKEDPTTWRGVIHSGEGACGSIAFYVTQKVSPTRPAKSKLLRKLDGSHYRAGVDAQVCGSCGYSILVYSQRYVDWKPHFLSPEDDYLEGQKEKTQEDQRDPRSGQNLQQQSQDLLSTLSQVMQQHPNQLLNGPIGTFAPGATPTQPHLGPRLPMPLQSAGPIEGFEPELEPDIPYQPYPQNFDPQQELPQQSDPWNNIGQMIEAADSIYQPAPGNSFVPTDTGLPPDSESISSTYEETVPSLPDIPVQIPLPEMISPEIASSPQDEVGSGE